MSFVSVLLLDLDLSNDLPSSYLFLMDVSTFLSDYCDFYVFLTLSMFFFAMEGVASFTTLGYVTMSTIPYLTILSVVVNTEFSEDMISVLDLLYLVNYKIKVRF